MRHITIKDIRLYSISTAEAQYEHQVMLNQTGNSQLRTCPYNNSDLFCGMNGFFENHCI